MLEDSELWECQKHQMKEFGGGKVERKIKKAHVKWRVSDICDDNVGTVGWITGSEIEWKRLSNAVVEMKFPKPDFTERHKIISQSPENYVVGNWGTGRAEEKGSKSHDIQGY